MMKSYRELSLREIKMKKSTSLLLFFSFFISSFIILSVVLSVPLVQKLSRQQFERTQGNWHINMTTDSEPDASLPTEEMDASGYMYHLGTAPIQDTGLSLSMESYDKAAREMWPGSFQLLEGKYPEKAGEIALEERDFELLNIPKELGQTVILDVSSIKKGEKKSYEYTVCGILDTCRKMALLGGHLGLISEEEAKQGKAEQNCFLRLRSPQKLEETLYIDRLTEKYHATTWKCNNYLLQAYGIFPVGSDKMEYCLTWIPLLLVGSLVLLAVGLVVYNVLKLFLLKKMGQYGTLRAIGAERKQVYDILFGYIFMIALFSLPPGIITGGFGARICAVMVSNSFRELLLEEPGREGLPEIIANIPFFSFHAVGIAAVILLLFTMAASLPVIYSITKQSPVEAMKGDKNRIRYRRNRSRKEIKNINRYLAKLNTGRNRGRSIITVFSIIISISAVIGLTAYFKLKEIQQEYNTSIQGDYVLTAPLGAMLDMNPGEIKEALNENGYLKDEIDGLRKKCDNCIIVPQVYFTLPYGFGGATEKFPEQAGKISLFGLDDVGIEYFAPDLSSDAAKKLADGSGILYYRYGAQGNMEKDAWEAYVNYAMENDVITIAGRQYEVLYDLNYEPEARVLMNLNSPYGCTHLFLSEKPFCRVLGTDVLRYSQISIILKEGADTGQVIKAIEDFRNSHPGSGFQDFYSRRKEFAKERQGTRKLGYLIAVLVATVGLFNIISTSHENLHTRMKEIGTCRAIGMSRTDLEKSFLWEGFYYGIFSALTGVLAGVSISWYFAAGFLEKGWLHEDVINAVPWGMAILTGIAAVLICIGSLWLPLRKIKKMDIIDCLRFME